MVWELDSENGLLSYTKMKYIQELKMVRQAKVVEFEKDDEAAKKGKVDYEPYPVCGTRTGWFSESFWTKRDSDISDDLGVGISTYFKQLKTLTIMFAVFTYLSLPAYILFWSAGRVQQTAESEGTTLSGTDYLFGLSLGNLGDESKTIVALSPTKAKQRV